jgi:glycine hydroxymethyltransferase
MAWVIDTILRHEGWRSRCVNLVASENLTSIAVRTILASDLGHRYSLRGTITEDNFYMGTKYIEEILDHGTGLARRLFSCRHADLRPISGHMSAMAVLMSLTQKGDSIMSLELDDGGCPGYTTDYLPTLLHLHVYGIPFDRERLRVDDDQCATLIHAIKPRLVVVGPSVTLFPSPLRKTVKACKDINAELVYDGSHVLGLIAGKAFPNALREGAEVLLGSTHKSLPGPQGGILLTDQKHRSISERLELRVVDNPHFNRIAALAMAIQEMLRFGSDYATQVVKNGRALARALDRNGVQVQGKRFGYTETHQVLLKRFDNDHDFAKCLEACNIIIDSSLRLGTSEVTRRGMKENEMRYIAELIGSVYSSRTSRNLDGLVRRVKKEIKALSTRFNKIEYAFDSF